MAFLAHGQPANAQNRTQLVAPDNSVIVVTADRAIAATKTDTPLVETPQSISVITDRLIDILSYSLGILASS